MKKNLNVIQINGIRGLFLMAGIVVCAAVGFIWFPGWVGMHIWNYATVYITNMPAIGIIQGMLLWGIIVASYFTFRKNKLVVCMRASDGLSEEELKKVFADMKQQAQMDPILRNMIMAREAELRIKKLQENNVTKAETQESKEKVESK